MRILSIKIFQKNYLPRKNVSLTFLNNKEIFYYLFFHSPEHVPKQPVKSRKSSKFRSIVLKGYFRVEGLNESQSRETDFNI